MKKKVLLLLCVIGVFVLVSASLRVEDGIEKDMVRYLESTVETEDLKNPDKAFYESIIKPEELSDKRQMVWECWKQANASRLSTWRFSADNNWLDSLKWQLPGDQEMLFAVLKKGERPASGYPLFINLHGGGTTPTEPGPWTSKINNSEWAAAKTLAGMYQDAPSIYFVPRMPDDRRGRWYHSGAATAWIRAWQLGVLSGDIDPNRTYILGISEGGYGSFKIGIFFADYFAGAGPMAGAVWKDQEHIENLRNTAFFIGVGENDHAYGRATNAYDWKVKLDSAAQMNNGQFVHKVDIQKGRGHGINYMKASPWLKQYKRKTYPDTLSMVYYSQCDTIYGGEPGWPCNYRKGFGYVRLDHLSKTGERRFYIEKQGNTYKITSDNLKGSVNGKIRLYVDLVNFDEPIKVSYNRRQVFRKKLKPELGTMLESLALFGDPERIFPSFVDINVD